MFDQWQQNGYLVLQKENSVSFSPPSPISLSLQAAATVINVLTCIIDAWHYDNGSESPRGGQSE